MTLAPSAIKSYDDIVQETELAHVNSYDNAERTFQYAANDKQTKSKLVKGAKKDPFEIDENSSSININFNLGSWTCIVIPVVKYWESIKGTIIEITQNRINVTDVKTGQDSTGKIMDSQVTFYLNNEKVVLHCYHTTQRILVNGLGYKKIVDLFLKPFFENKVKLKWKEIDLINKRCLEHLLGTKIVKRADISTSTKRLLSFTPLRTAKKSKVKSPISVESPKLIPHLLNEDQTIVEEIEDDESLGGTTIPVGAEPSISPIGSRQGCKLGEVSTRISGGASREDVSPTDGPECSKVVTLEERSTDNLENVQSLKCKRCQFVAKSQILLTHHLSYWCGICGLCFPTKIDFDTHMHLHDQCLEKSCGYKSSDNKDLSEHVKKTHFTGFKCENCSESFENKKDLYAHDKTHHVTIKVFEKQNQDIRNEISNLKNEVNSALEKILGNFERNMIRLEDKLTSNNEDLKELIKEVALKEDERSNDVIEQSKSTAPKSYAQATKNTGIQKSNNDKKVKPKSHVLFIGDSLLHQCDFKGISISTNTAIRTQRAYSSVKDDSSWFPDSNIEDMTKSKMKDSVDHLVLGASSVDITNLNTHEIGNIEKFRGKVANSCSNIVKVAESSLEKFTNLKNVTIIPHAPRYDTHYDDPAGIKANLAKFANEEIVELVKNSLFSDKIFVGRHSIQIGPNEKLSLFSDDRSGKYDGVHMYSSKGRAAYTESVESILRKSLKQQEKENRRNVVVNCPTMNRFSVLGN